jgi:hypothetical protein
MSPSLVDDSTQPLKSTKNQQLSSARSRDIAGVGWPDADQAD